MLKIQNTDPNPVKIILWSVILHYCPSLCWDQRSKTEAHKISMKKLVNSVHSLINRDYLDLQEVVFSIKGFKVAVS